MKIAYIILAHKNIPQLKWLLQALEDDRVNLYLHLDKGADKSLHEQARTELAGIRNLFFLKAHFTNWGSFGLVDATLEGMRQVKKHGGADYTILLSGQDYPIKSTSELISFLEHAGGKSFIEYFKFPVPHWQDNGGFDRIQKWYLSLPIKYTAQNKLMRGRLNQMLNILFPNRRFPVGLIPYGGSQWWCLNRECIDHIIQFCKSHWSYVSFFKTIRVPDEIFFHTILLNSPLTTKLENRALTYVDWNGPPYPRILTETDVMKLTGGDYFFARKFDLETNQGIFSTIARLTIDQVSQR